MASREDVRRMAQEVRTCGFDLSALETGESGGQEESLFSGDSLSLAFALPGLSVGLPGGLEPRPPVAPPWLTCARVGLLGAPRMSWKGTVARMGCRRQPLLNEPGEPALLRLTRGCWSELLGADILPKVARGFLQVRRGETRRRGQKKERKEKKRLPLPRKTLKHTDVSPECLTNNF